MSTYFECVVNIAHLFFQLIPDGMMDLVKHEGVVKKKGSTINLDREHKFNSLLWVVQYLMCLPSCGAM